MGVEEAKIQEKIDQKGHDAQLGIPPALPLLFPCPSHALPRRQCDQTKLYTRRFLSMLHIDGRDLAAQDLIPSLAAGMYHCEVAQSLLRDVLIMSYAFTRTGKILEAIQLWQKHMLSMASSNALGAADGKKVKLGEKMVQLLGTSLEGGGLAKSSAEAKARRHVQKMTKDLIFSQKCPSGKGR